MATRNGTITVIDADIVVFTWAGLLQGDQGDNFQPGGTGFAGLTDKSVHVTGTFGVGGTIVIEGSNDPAAALFNTLNDPQGTALSLTAAAIKQLLEAALIIRPRVTAGDAATNLTVRMILVKHR